LDLFFQGFFLKKGVAMIFTAFFVCFITAIFVVCVLKAMKPEK
jgi:hypothetical protein